MFLVFLSFLAGILTVLAPCSFMLLPVIIGGSASSKSKLRPYVITISLATSLFLFALVLKVSTAFANIDPVILNYFSGGIVIFLGLVSLFPEIWEKIEVKLKLSQISQKFLSNSNKKDGLLGAVLTGAALGPVFSSCSPTFAFLIGNVLRENLTYAIINMLAYSVGLALIMLAVALLGQQFISKLKWAVNPKGIFKRIISVLFILIGIAILLGIDKQIQANFASIPLVGDFEKELLNRASGNEAALVSNSKEILNVNPARKAPEITGINDWINSDPQTLADLKGKVVLVDFWTYSCINCLRTAPYLNAWYSTYKDDGFVILGIHAPEFAFERNIENVRRAADDDYKIEYPVGLDNEFATWEAFNNQFWPAKYLIDAEGNIRYQHFGEGKYAETERAIQLLLEENGKKTDKLAETPDEVNSTFNKQTPETYLGYLRLENFANKDQLRINNSVTYSFKDPLGKDFWTLEGNWEIRDEFSKCIENCKLKLNFSSKKVYLVISLADPAVTDLKLKVKLNNQTISADVAGKDVANGEVAASADSLYELVSLKEFSSDQILELEPQPGLQFNAFTFGT